MRPPRGADDLSNAVLLVIGLAVAILAALRVLDLI